jgi:transposase
MSRTKAINELKSLIVVAPEHLRAQLRGLGLAKLLDRIDRFSSPTGAPLSIGSRSERFARSLLVSGS